MRAGARRRYAAAAALATVAATLVAASPVAVAQPRISDLTISSFPPNPAKAQTEHLYDSKAGSYLKVSLRVDQPARVSLTVARSRVVAHKLRPVARAGKVSFTWDGRNQAGYRVLAGKYRIRLRAMNADGRDTKLASVQVTRGNPAAPLDRRSVLSRHIREGAIDREKLADSSVSAEKIAAEAVTSGKIAAGTVGSYEIADDALTTAEILDGTVIGADIADETITAADIATDAIDSAEIATGAVGSSELATDAVGADEIATDAVGSAEIAADAVSTAEILDGTVAIGDVAQSVWSSAVHAAGPLASRPAASASNDGYLYLATDESGGTLYRSDGTSWTKAGPGVDEASPSTALPADITMLAHQTNAIWSNQPAALTEFLGTTRHRAQLDLTNASQARIVVNVMTAGAATPAKIRAQYSADGGTSWFYLDGASGPSVNINSIGLKTSSWVSLVAGAKADVMLRIVGLDGNGAADPAFGRISVQVKR